MKPPRTLLVIAGSVSKGKIGYFMSSAMNERNHMVDGGRGGFRKALPAKMAMLLCFGEAFELQGRHGIGGHLSVSDSRPSIRDICPTMGGVSLCPLSLKLPIAIGIGFAPLSTIFALPLLRIWPAGFPSLLIACNAMPIRCFAIGNVAIFACYARKIPRDPKGLGRLPRGWKIHYAKAPWFRLFRSFLDLGIGWDFWLRRSPLARAGLITCLNRPRLEFTALGKGLAEGDEYGFEFGHRLCLLEYIGRKRDFGGDTKNCGNAHLGFLDQWTSPIATIREILRSRNTKGILDALC